MKYLCSGQNICFWYIYVQDGLYVYDLFMFRTDDMFMIYLFSGRIIVFVIFMFRTEYMSMVYLCSGRNLCSGRIVC